MAWRKTTVSFEGETKGPKRVLVIQLGGVAEFVSALAAAKRIREAHVGARITLLATEATRALAETAPYFDTVEADGKPTDPQAITKLIMRLRAAKYDMVYDLEGSSRTNNYFQGMRPWLPKWSGPAAGASHACLDPDRDELHALDRYERQLAIAGIASARPLLADLAWVRSVLRDPPRLQPEYFGIRGRFIVLLPRGSDAEPARRWPEAKYVEVARRAALNGITPLVLGGEAERAVGAAVAKAEPRSRNLVTRADLFQSIGLFERAALAVGDDVDLMHVAAAAGAPCVAFLSTLNDPVRATPRGAGGVIALTATVIADLSVEQVERQIRNCGVYARAATA